MTGTQIIKLPGHGASSVPRRVLGQQLRSLRQKAGLPVQTAARLMEWSEPKLWRVENGQTVVRAIDAQAMCALCNASPELTETLTELARHTMDYGWWNPDGKGIAAHLSIYAELEGSACNLLGYASGQVPGLLRTEDYARAVMTGGDAERRVHECLARQIVMFRAKAPLWVTVVLSEAILRCPVGGTIVMAGQLRHLAEIATLPNVCLRVVPFSAGSHPGVTTGTFTLLEFPPIGRSKTGSAEIGSGVVHAAGLTGELYLDKLHEIRSYREAHAAILGCALSESDSRDLLGAAAKELE